MAFQPRSRALVAVAGGALLAAASALPARAEMPCPVVSLKSARGVIGEEHSYKVTGRCEKNWSKSETSWAGWKSKTTNLYMGMNISGSTSWNRKTGIAKESISFTGLNASSPTGKRVVRGVCSQDPFLMDPPGVAASCHSIEAQAEVISGPTLELLTEKTFWLGRRIGLAEAQALSQQAAAAPPPPAPPAPKKLPPGLKDARAATSSQSAKQPIAPLASAVKLAMLKPTPVAVEAEALLAAGKATVRGGALAAQPMREFGAGWSDGAQLFWHSGDVGAVLDLVVDVPVAGRYSLALYLTRAPDYALLQLEVDGARSVTFDGFAERVEPSGPVRAGSFDLQAGPRRISLMILGRHAQSTGHFAGVDRIELLPVGGS
jgi:hypothetical protein